MKGLIDPGIQHSSAEPQQAWLWCSTQCEILADWWLALVPQGLLQCLHPAQLHKSCIELGQARTWRRKDPSAHQF